MKCLILNGSPRKNGKIGQLMQHALQIIGEDAELIHVYDRNIRYCVGCMRCREMGSCVLPQDEGHELAEKIRQADLLIVGSPTYWGSMSARLKNLFERTVPVFMGETSMGIPVPRQKGKKAIVIATCSTPWPFNIFFKQSRGTVRSIREVLKTAGYKVQALEVPGTKKMEVLPEKYGHRLARMINRNKKQ